MTKQTPLLAITLILALSLAAHAQRPGHPAVNPVEAFQVLGTVVDFSADYGTGMPTLTVDDPALGVLEIRLGPVWFLSQEGFSATPGDEVELLAYPCVLCDADAAAAWVDNLTTGASVVLRDEDGLPLWIGRGGGGGGHPYCGQGGPRRGPGGQGGGPGMGNGGGSGNGPGEPGEGGSGPGPGEPGPGDGPGPGPGGPGPNPNPGGYGGQCEWNGPDMSAVTTVTGTVEAVSVPRGARRPTLVLTTSEGELELFLSPYQPIAAAGFLIEPGMELTVTYAPWQMGDEVVLVVLSLTDPLTGLTIQLRDPETGYPLYSGHGHGRD